MAVLRSAPSRYFFNYLGWGLKFTHLFVLNPLPTTETQFLRCIRKVCEVQYVVIEFVKSR